MNSLNLLSSRVIGQTPLGSRPRSKSQGEDLRRKLSEELLRGRSYSDEKIPNLKKEADHHAETSSYGLSTNETDAAGQNIENEKVLLLHDGKKADSSYVSTWKYLIKRIADALTALLATIGMPLVYIAKCFEDEDGRYSPIAPFKRKRRRRAVDPKIKSEAISEKPPNRVLQETKLKHSYSSDSLTSMSSESDSDRKTPKGSIRIKKEKPIDEDGTRRRSSRIRLLQHDEVAKRKQKRSALAENPLTTDSGPLTVDNIKSPISASTASKLRYPHAPQPPRPLVPRRQPSYSNLMPLSASMSRRMSHIPQTHHQKTLILDLDETLIHSIAKGGRMSNGHMVEVKLNVPVLNPVTQVGGQGQAMAPPIIGPQHPILYYVHKRPHCDEFLRKVCKWYKVVIFTASVQEYADPVIDWLEVERKYFVGRYYRQHCTFRNGSYIKDLSSIEPDLSKVIILDNSPVSYVFHEDNAIPIEGWINDPTDNDLLHLIPMLEALQYVTDVRALLALRRGEAEAATSA